MSKKYVYLFKEGNADMRELLGGKGANLAEMTNLGLPIPQGFTVSTEACTEYYNDGKKINDEIQSQIFEALKKRWILIVSITLVATLISGVLSFFVIKPTYETSTKVFIGKEESNQEGYNTNDIQMYQKLLQTYAETIKTNEVVQAAINSTNIFFNIYTSN